MFEGKFEIDDMKILVKREFRFVFNIKENQKSFESSEAKYKIQDKKIIIGLLQAERCDVLGYF